MEVMKSNKGDQKGIDFISFSRKWCDGHQNLKGVKNYRSAINSFCAFFGREHVLCSEVTVKSMKAFEEFLDGKKRAKSLYTSKIARLFNEAREHYNDEGNDIIRIKNSLSRYKPPMMNAAEKRALSLEQVRSIFALPYSNAIRNGNQCAVTWLWIASNCPFALWA